MSTIEAMGRVAKSLKSVAMANMQRYKARHIYDVYNMIQPLLARESIMVGRELVSETVEKVTSKNGNEGTHRYQVWRFKFIAAGADDSFVTEFPAESIDWGDKSASQCDAMAFKQMLIHTFLIPTKDMPEPDDSEEKTKRSVFDAPDPSVLSKKQLTALSEIMKEKGFKKEDVKAYSSKFFQKEEAKDLSEVEFNTLISTLKNTTPETLRKNL